MRELTPVLLAVRGEQVARQCQPSVQEFQPLQMCPSWCKLMHIIPYLLVPCRLVPICRRYPESEKRPSRRHREALC